MIQKFLERFLRILFPELAIVIKLGLEFIAFLFTFIQIKVNLGQNFLHFEVSPDFLQVISWNRAIQSTNSSSNGEEIIDPSFNYISYSGSLVLIL